MLVLGHTRPFFVWLQPSGSQMSWSQKGGHKLPGHKRRGHQRAGHKRPGHKRPPTGKYMDSTNKTKVLYVQEVVTHFK